MVANVRNYRIRVPQAVCPALLTLGSRLELAISVSISPVRRQRAARFGPVDVVREAREVPGRVDNDVEPWGTSGAMHCKLYTRRLGGTTGSRHSLPGLIAMGTHLVPRHQFREHTRPVVEDVVGMPTIFVHSKC